MLVSTLRWREMFKAEEIINEQFPEEIFGKLGYNFGKDKDGRPVTYVISLYTIALASLICRFRYNVYGGNKDLEAVFGDIQRFLRSVGMSWFSDRRSNFHLFKMEGFSYGKGNRPPRL